MCDCGEELERRRKLKLLNEAAAQEADLNAKHASIASGGSSPPSGKYRKQLIIGLTTLLCGLLAVVYTSVDRKTIRKILTMFGLGWLISNPCRAPCGEPCPKINPAKRKWPCDDKKKPEPIKTQSCTCDEDDKK